MTHIQKFLWKLFYIRELVKTAVRRFLDRGDIDRARIRSILVVRLYGIGNMVLATPALNALKRGYPDAKITVLVSDTGAWDVVSGGGVVDSLMLFNPEKPLDPALIRRLRSARFDLMVVLYPMGVVDLPLSTAVSAIRYRFGYRNAVKGNLYTHRFDTDYGKSEGRLNLDLACRAGGKKAGARPFFSIGTADRQRIDRLFADNRIPADEPVIAFHPGGGLEMKRWPPENFGALGDMLARDCHARIVLVGGPNERQLCREISAQMKSEPIVGAGLLSLKETAEVIRRSALFVGNDSGPMHIAAALSTPTIGLFGPTDRVKNRPWGKPDMSVIVWRRIGCAPCYRKGEVPCIHETNLCMTRISVEDVYNRSMSLLGDNASPRRYGKLAP